MILKKFHYELTCDLISFVQPYLTVQTVVQCTLLHSSNCSAMYFTLYLTSPYIEFSSILLNKRPKTRFLALHYGKVYTP